MKTYKLFFQGVPRTLVQAGYSIIERLPFIHSVEYFFNTENNSGYYLVIVET